MAKFVTKLTVCMSVIFISVFFNCASTQQTKNNQKHIKFKYYTVFYQFQKKETHFLEISLKSHGAYKINGKKYPPIKMTLFENKNLNIDPLDLTANQLDQNTTVSWNVFVSNQKSTKKEVIHASLDTIICLKDKCIIENNKLQFNVYF